jgi:hypothetical protein
MKLKAKKISPAVFGIIIICFFFPFMDISCSGQKVISFSGIQMVTGTTIEKPTMFGEKTENEKIDPEPLAVATFVFVIAGLLLSFVNIRKSAILPAIFALIGIITLLMLRVKIDNDILKQGEGVIQVAYIFGFWSILFFLIIATLLNIYIFLGKNDTL